MEVNVNQFRGETSQRTETRTIGGKFKGGKLAPVMMVPFRESESGIVNQTISLELDPIEGRMVTPITAGCVSVFVPVPAMDALKDPEQAYPGSADVIRAKLMSGANLFGVEQETEISKRLGISPRSVSGVKYVSEVVKLGHNVAVNYLRQRKYVNATKLDANSTAMTPALISNTVLQRLNAVLDPEDRVNGRVDFTGQIPVMGIGIDAPSASTNGNFRQTDGSEGNVQSWFVNHLNSTVSLKVAEDPNNTGFPRVYADLGGAAGITLQDFYEAQMMDTLMRQMRKIVDDNPEHGEEMATRWALGLSVTAGAQPFVVYENEDIFGTSFRRATDGAGMDDSRTETGHRFSFSVPIPKTEFGGVLVTFAYVKPDETLASQPHPYLSEGWAAQNFVQQKMALDPVPVTVRDLDSDCDVADEANVMCYIGNNGLKKRYVNYGWNRQLDTTTVEAKNSIWQLDVPMSVTPDNIVYPDDIEQFPFQDQFAEICTYTCDSRVTVQTPTIFGPIPVEELAQVETDDIFGDAE